MPRKITLKGIKKKAHDVFSKYIRRLNSDSSDMCICVTCGAIMPWQEIQNGHYFKRNRLGTAFHEDNCHPQCKRCNIFMDGNYTAYAAYMYKKYGQEKMEQLEQLSRKLIKFTIQDYQEMIEGWQTMMERMK